MDLQEAIKKAIQKYMDGEDVLPEGRKYTKSYLDNFHEEQTNAKIAAQSEKKVKKELKNASNIAS